MKRLVPTEQLTDKELDQLASNLDTTEPEHAKELRLFKRLRTQFGGIMRAFPNWHDMEQARVNDLFGELIRKAEKGPKR